MKLHPLVFNPQMYARVWGGRNLENILKKQLPGTEPIGESWEIHDHSTVKNGEFQNRTLSELLHEFPKDIAGDKYEGGDFPLLIKFLDAQEWLSVQVHPDDELAQKLENQPRGKTECWYILDAKGDAVIIYGLSEQLDVESFSRSIEEGTIKDKMNYLPVKKGDFVFVPAKTIHAIGPGIVLYELQQTSDTTYRLYDWDRMGLDGKPRELHLDKGLLSSNFNDIKPTVLQDFQVKLGNGYKVTILTNNGYFSLYHYHGMTDAFEVNMGNNPHIISVIKGAVTIKGDFDDVEVKIGETCLVPACIINYTIAHAYDAEFLCASY